MPVNVEIKTRRGTAAEWASANPVLALGELGVETDTHKIKAGDDETHWNDLPYITGPVDGDNVSLQVKRDTDANLSALTTPFLSGQFGYGQTTGKTVIGDGESLFDELPDIRDQFQTIVTVRKTGKGKFSCANPAYSTDAECIQAALDHISSLGGGVLHIEKGHYICNSQLLYTGSNLYFEGEGENTILDFSGASSGIRCIYVHGDISTTNSLLSSDASISNTTIITTSGDGTKFSVGDWCRIRSDAVFNSGTQHIGELQKIKTITEDTLTFYEPLFSNYLISDSATVDKFLMIQNISILNIKIITINNKNQYGITCSQANNVSIKNIISEDFADRAIDLINVVSANIKNNNIKRSNKTGYGYGIAIVNASRDIICTHNIFYDCRHGITCGGDDTFGVQYNQIYDSNIQSYNMQGQGMIGAHNTYDGMLVCNNAVSGKGGLGYFPGINALINGNTVSKCTDVAGIRTGSTTTIINNTIDVINQYGIQFLETVDKYDVQICNNKITTTSTGIYCAVPASHIRVCGNTIITTGVGIYFLNYNKSSDSTDISIVDNKVTGSICIYIHPYEYNITNLNIYNNRCIASTSSIELWGESLGGKSNNVAINANFCSGGTYGITLMSSDTALISNNTVLSASYGIYIKTNAVGCINYTIINNKLTGCNTPITDKINHTTKRITGNDGYKTENTGTATITASQTSVTISHGLVAAPTSYSVTPSANIGNCWIDTITSTQMTIHCSTAPEADTAVSWSAQVV